MDSDKDRESCNSIIQTVQKSFKRDNDNRMFPNQFVGAANNLAVLKWLYNHNPSFQDKVWSVILEHHQILKGVTKEILVTLPDQKPADLNEITEILFGDYLKNAIIRLQFYADRLDLDPSKGSTIAYNMQECDIDRCLGTLQDIEKETGNAKSVELRKLMPERKSSNPLMQNSNPGCMIFLVFGSLLTYGSYYFIKLLS